MRTKKIGQRIGIGAALTLALCASGMARGEMKVEPLVVGPAMNDVWYIVIPAGGHVAAGMMKGSRFVVTVDGVEGPKVDAVMMVTSAAGVVSPPDPKSGLPGYQPKPVYQTPVVFSEDGKRYAYMARIGQEYLVVVDGQEQRRFPVAPGAQVRMQFTGPEAKHHFMTVSNMKGTYDVWVDGTQMMPHDGNDVPVFSKDGARYAYMGVPDANDRTKQVMVVDGKDVGYTGDAPRFTADGKHVVTVTVDGGAERAVLVDGAPVVKSPAIMRVFLAPAGDKIVTVVSKPAQGGAHYVCVVDGKEIPATEGTDQPYVTFSPNGTRWAARCKNIVGAYVTWVVTDDGKKGQEYNSVADDTMVFSPDGSRFAYVAGSGGKTFAIVDGQESDGFNLGVKVGFSPDGKQVYYGGGRQLQTTIARVLTVEGKAYTGDNNFITDSITFSSNGAHWGVLGSGLKTGGPAGLQAVDNLLVDGNLVAGFTVSRFNFSPDGSNLAFIGQRRSDGANGLFLNEGKPLKLNMGTRGRGAIFSPDGRHLFWTTLATDPATNRPTHYVYADGKEVAKFDNVSLGNFETEPGAWRVEPDGSLMAIGAVGEQVIRYRVTPGEDTSVTGAADEFVAAEAKAVAEKQAAIDAAAKLKADQLAAAKKAQEDAAKAKAEALAAKKKAAEEAAAAKKKAAEDAAAAKKKPK